jgi:hypothetical protein
MTLRKMAILSTAARIRAKGGPMATEMGRAARSSRTLREAGIVELGLGSARQLDRRGDAYILVERAALRYSLVYLDAGEARIFASIEPGRRVEAAELWTSVDALLAPWLSAGAGIGMAAGA